MLTNTNSFEVVTFRIIFLFVTDKLVYSLPSHMLRQTGELHVWAPWRSCYMLQCCLFCYKIYCRPRVGIYFGHKSECCFGHYILYVRWWILCDFLKCWSDLECVAVGNPINPYMINTVIRNRTLIICLSQRPRRQSVTIYGKQIFHPQWWSNNAINAG